MSKTERFEMRLDEETVLAVDAWRDANLSGASRAQAVRALIGRGLQASGEASPGVSAGEQALLTMMGDLFRHLGVPAGSDRAEAPSCATPPRQPGKRPAADRELSFHKFGLLAPRVNALSRALTRSAVHFAKTQFGLSQVEWQVVTLLGAFQPVAIGELAYHAMLDAGQMSRAVSALVKRGCVARERSELDSREMVLTLTADGESMRKRLTQAAAARNRHVVGDVPEGELVELYGLLEAFIGRARQLVE